MYVGVNEMMMNNQKQRILVSNAKGLTVAMTSLAVFASCENTPKLEVVWILDLRDIVQSYEKKNIQKIQL